MKPSKQHQVATLLGCITHNNDSVSILFLVRYNSTWGSNEHLIVAVWSVYDKLLIRPRWMAQSGFGM